MSKIRASNRIVAGFSLLMVLALSLSGQTSLPGVRYVGYTESQLILEALAEALPTDLRSKNPGELAKAWPNWVRGRDSEIRVRLAQGDEDSLVNFLLFGISYTKQPRITAKELAEIKQDSTSSAGNRFRSSGSSIIRRRIDDLIRALSAAGRNERLLFARRLLIEQRGHNLNTPAGRAELNKYLLASVSRVLNERAGHDRTLEAARLLASTTEEFAERSRLYRTRGLSSDTSLLPNFALEESLKAMQGRGLLGAGSIRRIAIIGPGLDFADKQEGYDFYPQQTIQPFAIIDTLSRLGLAKPEALQVTTFDLSPRVNHHLELAQKRARRGHPYVVQLPRDPQAQWKPAAVRFWEHFGNQIGITVPPVAIPASAGELKIRAVSIHPGIAARITPIDLNIVLQHLDLPARDRFDLIIATNIFVYYDTFEQSLGMANVERMLRPGGVMLSNNVLLELPFSRMHSIDYLTVVYSERPNDGDHIVWYQRASD
ncbi:MAG: class I SAM-dependent methyltransferase [Pyrinomonadaceae bacterium]|nr:class I SAM-dependent methyltransferase [Pyrinomonadaceae bacterium]